MAAAEQFDPRFSLPGVDDPPLTEVGVVLIGLDAARLLAGLAAAGSGDDPALVTLAVDEARHGVAGRPAFDELIGAGVALWSEAATRLARASAPATPSASPRRQWASAMDALVGVGMFGLGPAVRAYLAACWLRRDDVDAYALAWKGVDRCRT